MSENNVNGITGADVATTTGIVGATVAIGQYIINDYVITIAEAEGDYGYTMTITRGTDTQTVTLYGLTPEQYNSMLGYLQQAQEAAQNAAGSASDAYAYLELALDAANRANTQAARAEQASDTARSYASQAQTAKQGAETAKTDAQTARTQAQGYWQAAEAAATRAGSAATRAETALAAAETAQSAAEAAQTAAEAAETDTQTYAGQASQSAANAAQSAASAAQTLAQVQAEGQAQIAAIDTEGQRVIDSIPEDYSQMEEDVADLKSHFSIISTETKNLYNKFTDEIGVLSSDGSIREDDGTYFVSDYIDVGSKDFVISWGSNPSDGYVRVGFYNDSKVFQTRGLYTVASNVKSKAVTNSSYKYIRVSFKRNIDKLQVENSTVATEYVEHFTAYDIKAREDCMSLSSALTESIDGAIANKTSIENIPVVQGLVNQNGERLTGDYDNFWVTDYIKIPDNAYLAKYNAVTNGNYIACYDANRNYICKVNNPVVSSVSQHDMAIPLNAVYIVLSTYQAQRPTDLYVEFQPGSVYSHMINTVNPFIDIELVAGFIDANGQIVNDSVDGRFKRTRPLPIPYGCSKIFHNFKPTSYARIGFYGFNMELIGTDTNTTDVYVPTGAAYVVLSDDDATTEHSGLFMRWVCGNINELIEEQSKYAAMRKKKIVFMGDSITDTNVSGRWVNILKQKVYGLDITDYARGAAAWTNYDDTAYDLSSDNVGNHNNVIWNQFNRMKKDIDDGIKTAPDYVFIFGGMNDILQNRPQGDITTAFTGTILDKQVTEVTTLAQSIRYVVQLIQNTYPGTIVVIGTSYGSPSHADRSRSISDLTRECANWMGCHVIDWNRELGINLYQEEVSRYYLQDDYVHPTNKGSELLAGFNALRMSQIIRD